MRYTEEMLHGSNKYELMGMKMEADSLLEAASAAVSLDELFAVHKSAYECGIWNGNMDVDKYGMFRAENMDALGRQDVYLGGRFGINTHELPFFEKLKMEDPSTFMVALNQYKGHLVSNIGGIGYKLETAIKEEEEENARPFLRRMFGNSNYAPRPGVVPQDCREAGAARLEAACLNVQKMTTLPYKADPARDILSSLKALGTFGVGEMNYFSLERNAFEANGFGYWLPVAKMNGVRYTADFVQKLDDDSFRILFRNEGFSNTPSFTVSLYPVCEVTEFTEGLEFDAANAMAQVAVNLAWQKNEAEKKRSESEDVSESRKMPEPEKQEEEKSNEEKGVEQKPAVSSAPKMSKGDAALLGLQHKEIVLRTLKAGKRERIPATPVVINGEGRQLAKEDGVSCSLMRAFYEDWLPDMLTVDEIHGLGYEIISPDVKPYLCKGVAHSDGTIGVEVRYNLSDTTFPEQEPEAYRRFCEYRRKEEKAMCSDFFKDQKGVIDCPDMNESMALEILDKHPQYEEYKQYVKTILYHNVVANLGEASSCGNFWLGKDLTVPDDQTAYRIHRAVGVYLDDKYEGTSRRMEFAPAKDVINTIKNNLQEQKNEAMRRRINGPENSQGKGKGLK